MPPPDATAEKLKAAREHRDRMETLGLIHARLSGTVVLTSCGAAAFLTYFGALAVVLIAIFCFGFGGGVPGRPSDADRGASLLGGLAGVAALLIWAALGYWFYRSSLRRLERKLAELPRKHPDHLRRWGGLVALRDLASVKEIIKIEQREAPPR